MKKWAMGCLGLFAASVALLICFFLFVPGPLGPIIAFEQRVIGLAEVKRAFPKENFAWSDIFQSYHVYSWDGTNTVWHFDPPDQPYRPTAHCAVQDVWDERGGNNSVKGCLIGEKWVCESNAHIYLYRVVADGSLIVNRSTGNDLSDHCPRSAAKPL